MVLFYPPLHTAFTITKLLFHPLFGKFFATVKASSNNPTDNLLAMNNMTFLDKRLCYRVINHPIFQRKLFFGFG